MEEKQIRNMDISSDTLPQNFDDSHFDDLTQKIEQAVNEAKLHLAGSVNSIIVATYWQVGKYIVEYEQQGNAYAQYGKSTLTLLAKRLTARLGRGFSRPNLNNMRKFYMVFPNCQTLSNKLGWSHICELLKIDDDIERQFYLHECENAHWDVRSLKRQIKSSLYLRLAASTDKKGIMELAEKGITIETPQNTIRSEYTLEFCGLPARKRYSEALVMLNKNNVPIYHLLW